MLQQWHEALTLFSSGFAGELHLDIQHRTLFSTDASVYKELPVAVAIVFTQEQLRQVVDFCVLHSIPIIARGAGTSLGGQVVGNGLVLDTSHLNTIFAVNKEESWVEVEPGVVLDELNRYLQQFSLFFGPETSTSSRCTIGGMVGNNSCGSRSLVYGSTRDHLIQVEGYLADGSFVIFGAMSLDEIIGKRQLNCLEGEIYRGLIDLLSSSDVRDNILKEYPHHSIKRRNGGYALDMLVNSELYDNSLPPFNICNIIAGSEGTLMILSKIRLHLVPLPSPNSCLIVAHFNSLHEALLANVAIVDFEPRAVELMDRTILDLTKDNIEQRRNRFFIAGEPEALLIIEVSGNDLDELNSKVEVVFKGLKEKDFGYHYAVVSGLDAEKVWSLRKAGLGVLSNMVGDAKPVSVIEDCAVRVEDLPNFCRDIESMLARYGKECVFHGHAGSGELHLRPILNLKDKHDVELFRVIAFDTALLVKKYGGSLSGEHGDGRVRGEFIPLMIGEQNYLLLCHIKSLFDSKNLLNPNKITVTPPMNSSLRFSLAEDVRSLKTFFNWDKDGSILQAAERCNGSGDCLKSSLLKGVMCPSYQATRNELFSPRGRANLAREYLVLKSNSNENIDFKAISDSLQLCLSCKACKSECPSNVDIAQLKAELIGQHNQENGLSLRGWVFANIGLISGITSKIPSLFNWFVYRSLVRKCQSAFLGISSKRVLPRLSAISLQKRVKHFSISMSVQRTYVKRVLLYNDEFTNYYNSEVGIKAIMLLQKLGYKVELFTVKASSRTHLSVGDLTQAKRILNSNLELLSAFFTEDFVLIGLEPSAILTFRDEALVLALPENKHLAEKVSKFCFTFEEFIASEVEAENISSSQFTANSKIIYFHGHCYQKALEKPNVIKKILSLPENYEAFEINSGCCGMGGAFGYEEEHYELSVQIAELVLLPKVRSLKSSDTVATSGFSCKHQIEDLSGKRVMHPAEILFEALL